MCGGAGINIGYTFGAVMLLIWLEVFYRREIMSKYIIKMNITVKKYAVLTKVLKSSIYNL